MTDVVGILTKARRLVERGWTQGAPARNAVGEAADKYADDAVCFCITAAIWRAAGACPEAYQAEKAFRKEAIRGGRIAYWNDLVCKSQAQALAAFDTAIRELTMMAAFDRVNPLAR